MDDRHHRRRQHGGFVWPIVLILVGVMFLLNNLGLIDIVTWDSIWQLWPLIFVAIGLDGLLRRNEIVGPVIMFGLGGVFLLSNFGWLNWNAWDTLWRLWPLLIIAIGLEIMVGRRSVWISILGVAVIFAALFGLLWLSGIGPLGGQPIQSELIDQELGDAIRAEISLSPVVGEMRVDALEDSNALIAGEVSVGRGRQVWSNYKLQGTTAVYSLGSRNPVSFPGNAWDWRLGLSPDTPIELEASMAAGDMDLDLAEVMLSGLDASQAVGDLSITLPAGEALHGDISQAVGQIVIYVPEDVSVRVEISKALSSLTVPSDFVERGDYYYSPGYESSDTLIDLDISQAIGNIVVRYQK
ncbi:MAG: hypothetical protein ISS57_08585 [Anaerolineales bacterium]|nr:hypothetical protein [Anaerolineales bacterium]